MTSFIMADEISKTFTTLRVITYWFVDNYNLTCDEINESIVQQPNVGSPPLIATDDISSVNTQVSFLAVTKITLQMPIPYTDTTE